MLEVIQSDFSRLEADTTAAETTAQKEYDEFMTSAKTDRAEKSTDLEHKTNKKAEQEVKLSTRKTILMARKKSSMLLSLTMTSSNLLVWTPASAMASVCPVERRKSNRSRRLCES